MRQVMCAVLTLVRAGVAPQPTGSSTQGLPNLSAAIAASFMPPTQSSDKVPTFTKRADEIRMNASTSPMECA